MKLVDLLHPVETLRRVLQCEEKQGQLDQIEANIVGLYERASSKEPVRIVPNERGGWSIEVSISHQYGNYATPADAERVCAMNFWEVEEGSFKFQVSGFKS